MKKLLENLSLQRILIACAHGHFRDTFRKGIALALRRRNKNRLKFPYSIALEVTNECPLNCIMCPRSQREENAGYMSLDLFEKIIDECSKHISMIDLVFTGMGEPLLHPRILEMFRIAKGRGIPTVRVVTNALLLTDEKAGKILRDSALDQISISLDALTPETYETIKGNSNFHIVQKNIEDFLDQREVGGYWKPFVSLHILKMRENVSEINEFVQKWKAKLRKGDRILIKGFHTFAGQVDDRRVRKSDEGRKRMPCRQLRELFYITWDGDVMPCCIDVLKKLKIGSLRESDLCQLWRSPAVRKMRKIHLKEEYGRIDLCKNCENWY